MKLSVCCLSIFTMVAMSVHAQEVGQEAKWYFSPSIGLYDYQGDEEVSDGYILSPRIGYDFNDWWSLEGVFTFAPSLDVGTRHSYGEVIPRNDFDSTWGAGLGIDALFHFTRWERLDPYLAVGGMMFWFGDEVDGKSVHPAVLAGGGVMYHFNDMWAIRGDARVVVAGSDAEANSLINAGIVWTWGAYVRPNILATDGPLDSDGDGLTDAEESQYGTDHLDPDTDNDGLKDGEEVKTYKTDPLNPDTDYDMLKDGAEVMKHETNPLDRDTDDGGVTDGHEVLEDNTDPRAGHGSDDLMMFELYIQFDYDKAIIKPAFFADLDVIGKVMTRNPDSSAKVEGHADQKKSSSARYNKKLSERRAQSVVKYLEETHNIAGGRLEAEGYGFERPKVKPDLVNGNPENRRVEIYIRGAANEGAVPKGTPPENK